MASKASAESQANEKETARIEAFSDGVFAIAITLLALEMKVPHVGGESGKPFSALLEETARLWPSYVAFVTSFLTILVMWVHHHRILRLVHRTDSSLLFSNGVFLLVVSAVPFPTAMLSEYLNTPAAAQAAGVYAGFYVLVAIGFQILRHFAFRKEMLRPDANLATIRVLSQSYRFGPLLYLIAAGSAALSVWLCLALCTALWVFWAYTSQDC
jgi:uncharacterized membrane protein